MFKAFTIYSGLRAAQAVGATLPFTIESIDFDSGPSSQAVIFEVLQWFRNLFKILLIWGIR